MKTLTVPVIWYAGRGFWDMGFLEDIFSLAHPAPFPVEFEHHMGFPDTPLPGAVVIIPARHHIERVAEIQAGIDALPWVMLFLTGDEEASFPHTELHHPNMSVWVQTPHPLIHSDPALHLYPEFSPPATREFYSTIPADREQSIRWAFMGQDNNTQRSECVKVLESMTSPGSLLLPTVGFTLGLPRETYLSITAASRVIPCPSGSFTPSTFRVFEALMAGAIPIVHTASPESDVTGYWPFVFGEAPPFPVLESWEEFHDALNRVEADYPASANHICAWWQGWMRRFVKQFYEDLLARSGASITSHPITVIISSSPIPTHPDTSILETTIASIRSRLPNAEVLLCLDGVREEQQHLRADYEEYQRRVLFLCANHWWGVTPIRFDSHTHQAQMTREALELVHTPQILFVEHDTPLVGDIPFRELSNLVRHRELFIVRLYPETSIPEEHGYLHLDSSPIDIGGVPIVRTIQYSQRPQLASAELYRRMLATNFSPGERAMIEDKMHGVVQSQSWDQHKIGIYAPPGNMKRSEHLDGRQDEPKWVD